MTRYLLTVLLCLAFTVTGLSSGAMRFDGVDDKVSLSSSILEETTHTVCAWVNLNNVGLTTKVIYAERNSGDAHSIKGQLYTYGSTAYYITRNDDNGNSALATATTVLQSNKWYHICGSRNGANVYIFIDGVQEGTDNDAGGTITVNDYQIGVYNSTGSYAGFFNGSIDEVLIYNVALTAEEVAAMYASSGAWHPKRGLVSRWSMENNGVSTGNAHANGSTINDSVGSNDGTVSDGADGSMTLQSSPVKAKRGRR